MKVSPPLIMQWLQTDIRTEVVSDLLFHVSILSFVWVTKWWRQTVAKTRNASSFLLDEQVRGDWQKECLKSSSFPFCRSHFSGPEMWVATHVLFTLGSRRMQLGPVSRTGFFKTKNPRLCLVPILPKFLLIALSVPSSKTGKKHQTF